MTFGAFAGVFDWGRGVYLTVKECYQSREYCTDYKGRTENMETQAWYSAVKNRPVYRMFVDVRSDGEPSLTVYIN